MMDISYIGTVLRHGAAALNLDSSQALSALASARGTLNHADRIAAAPSGTGARPKASCLRS